MVQPPQARVVLQSCLQRNFRLSLSPNPKQILVLDATGNPQTPPELENDHLPKKFVIGLKRTLKEKTKRVEPYISQHLQNLSENNSFDKNLSLCVKDNYSRFFARNVLNLVIFCKNLGPYNNLRLGDSRNLGFKVNLYE